MILRADGDTFELSTGRTFYANNGIIGISAPTKEFKEYGIYEGFDGGIDLDGYEKPWTKEELVELADYMVSLWEKFKSEKAV